MRQKRAATRGISPARRAAFQVLHDVAEGGFASDRLREVTALLEGRDAGLAGQLVFGVLRFRGQLDYRIGELSGRPAGELDAPVADSLRLGLFQLKYLDRIPTHAAVDESVELVKAEKRAAAGLVNAVLRKAVREADEGAPRQVDAWPDRATQWSCPLWLLERWDRQFGPEQADRIAEAALTEPDPYVRVAAGEPAPEGVELAATAVAGAYRVTNGKHPGLRFQDIGSQAIVPLLELRPGDRYLDVCAAPGNKMRQAEETRLGLSVACDVSEKRLREIEARNRVALDGADDLPFAPGTFDRILVDAPCSGTGTIGRNPEIKWRVQSGDFGKFANKQRRLVERALRVLAPGGKLLYATCSLEQEENEDVIREVCRRRPGVRMTQEVRRMPGREPGDGFYAALLESAC